jgi:hypothetical protein
MDAEQGAVAPTKELILLRGFPASGKSYRAKQLFDEAVDAGLEVQIFSTDEYWYKVLKPEKPEEYSFDRHFLADAHRWNQQRTFRAIEAGVPRIIVDNTNTKFEEMRPYAAYALPQGYNLRLEEPTSPWWLENRELLRRKKSNEHAIKRWAFDLAERSKGIHDVPFFAIERMAWRWEHLTAEEVVQRVNEAVNPPDGQAEAS